MPHLPRPVVERIARYAIRPWLRVSPRVRRPVFEVLAKATVVPGGVVVSRQSRAGIPGELLAPEGGAGPARILYLHGGAYEAGSARTHRAVVARLAAAARRPIFAADYRLAPEHPAPAALDDALAVYEALIAESADGLAVAGDSAGGGLSLALAVAARDRGLPPPSALALISPWVDLTMSGVSVTANERSDALLSRKSLDRGAAGYAAELGAEDPVCSPIRADLAGLPPMLIHTGADELLKSENQELARRAAEAGVDVEHRVFEGLWHDFTVHAGMLAEADEALAEIGEFLKSRLLAEAPAARS